MKRSFFLVLACSFGAVVYACGGTTSTDIDGGGDAASDATTGNDSGGNDSGGSDATSDAPGGDSGCGDAGCASFGGDCGDGGACGSNAVCVVKTIGPQSTHRCYPLPACGCNGKSACECVGACACGNETCTNASSGSINCLGPVSRREFKTDIEYVGDEERAALAKQALTTRLAEYRYKTEPDGTQRHLGFVIDDMPPQSPAVQSDATHVDLYGYTSMLVATVQEQQKQIDALKKQLDAQKMRR